MTDTRSTITGNRAAALVLLLSVFVLALCGLVYELIAGALSSYLLGDSITQFSLVIGLFLTAMGVGSYLSRFITQQLLAWFVGIEIAVGLVGGLTPLVGFATFAYTELYVPTLFTLVFVVGMLIGMEIPLMIRILRSITSLRVTVANVLAVDYIGGFAASILFPFALLPHLGLVRAGLVMGLSNTLVAALLIRRFGPEIGTAVRGLKISTASAMIALSASLVVAGELVTFLENQIYQDEVILARDTPYQRLVLTRWRDDYRLYLNGHLQFSSIDEYRYHETLVHPAMSLAARKERILILGGGDGLTAREVLKYPDVQRIDLVDIDPVVTDFFRDHPRLSQLNGHSLSDERVTIHNTDAMRFLEKSQALYDVIIMDLPDPSEPVLGKLYSQPFFRLVGRNLSEDGYLSCQATSPFRSREAFWCVVHTLDSARCGPEGTFQVKPYHTMVPTFGTWGFVVAGRKMPEMNNVKIAVPTRYLTAETLPGMLIFPHDMAEVKTPISRLNDAVVTRLYREGYHKYLD